MSYIHVFLCGQAAAPLQEMETGLAIIGMAITNYRHWYANKSTPVTAIPTIRPTPSTTSITIRDKNCNSGAVGVYVYSLSRMYK